MKKKEVLGESFLEYEINNLLFTSVPLLKTLVEILGLPESFIGEKPSPLMYGVLPFLEGIDSSILHTILVEMEKVKEINKELGLSMNQFLLENRPCVMRREWVMSVNYFLNLQTTQPASMIKAKEEGKVKEKVRMNKMERIGMENGKRLTEWCKIMEAILERVEIQTIPAQEQEIQIMIEHNLRLFTEFQSLLNQVLKSIT